MGTITKICTTFIFSFMSHFKVLLFILILCPLYLSCKQKGIDFSGTEFLITSNGDEESSTAADYLYRHISGRAKAAKGLHIIRSDKSLDNYTGGRIYLEIVPDLKHDYEIKTEVNGISIFGRDRSVLKWLSYMLIDHISKFQPLEVGDLPPGYIDFNEGSGSFAFSYREPHFSPNLNEDNLGILNTHSIDRDWGIWGHNLHKILADDLPGESYALVDGKRNKQQYCFSSNNIYRALEHFVADQYGEKKSKWFMIAPNDNDLVCNCSSCQRQGSKAGNATPAVVNLLNRLAERFPAHHFFTTAYRTTQHAPQTQTRKNVGVFISTIELPTNGNLNQADKAVQAFSNLVNEWSKKSDQIFLWDYVSNFDDYLTPYPVLSRTKSHLQFFRSLGCKGIFMNGSGYDYSTFDDVKTYVLSALMIDPRLSVEELVKKYFVRFYPLTGDLLASYYLQLERKIEKENIETGIYTGFHAASELYFDCEKFLQLFTDLRKLESKTKGSERMNVGRLITAMSYTFLQIAYKHGDGAGGFLDTKGEDLVVSSYIKEALERLENSQGYGGISVYKEDQGQLGRYCEEWRNQIQQQRQKNKIIGLKVSSLGSADQRNDNHFLFDNVLGFQSDFNQGWFLSSEDLLIKDIFFRPFKQTQNLSIRFLLNERHRMLPPEAIELFINGRFVDRIDQNDFINKNGLIVLNKDLTINQNEKLYIKIYKNRKINNSVIACDEIQLL